MDIDAIIARHGVAVQAVLTDHPYDPPFAYTIGRHLRGDPELIVFGGHHERATALLNELAHHRAAGDLAAGAQLSVDTFDGDPVGLVEARPEWVCQYGLLAFDHAGAPPWDVPFLQVQIPDPEGRLPGVDGRPATCWCCPDLSRLDRPYARAFDTTRLHELVPGQPPHGDDEVDVAVPVWVDDVAVGRVEALRARPRDADEVCLLQPPVLADWTTAGAVLRLTGREDPDGLPIAGAEVRTSPSVHLAWAWHVAGMTDAEAVRAEQAVERIAALDGVVVTPDPNWLTIAAPSRHSHRVRATMRRLVRDGLAVEAERFSRPSTACTHPGCQACGGPLHG